MSSHKKNKNKTGPDGFISSSMKFLRERFYFPIMLTYKTNSTTTREALTLTVQERKQ